MGEAKGGKERRRSARQHVAVIAGVSRGEGDPPTFGIVRDLSGVGAKLLCRSNLELGDSIELHFEPSEEGIEDERTVTGTVVRLDQLDEEQQALWRCSVGLEFESVPTELVEELVGLSEPILSLYSPPLSDD